MQSADLFLAVNPEAKLCSISFRRHKKFEKCYNSKK